jgi:hypothetical protein
MYTKIYFRLKDSANLLKILLKAKVMIIEKLKSITNAENESFKIA